MIVAAQPAPPAEPEHPTSFLVLKSGGALEVKSYSVEGRMVKIVGLEDEPLIMQTAQIDLEKSEEVTEQHYAKLREEEEARAEAEARAREEAALRAEERARQEAERAKRPRRGGGFSIAGGPKMTPKPAETEASTQPAEGETEAAGEPEKKGEAYYRGKNAEYKAKIEKLEKKLYQARGAYEKAKTDVTIGGATPQEQIDFDKARTELEATETDLESTKKAYAQFKEDARRAGAYPGWLR
jgi:hypothetical protein